jgi:DNA-binding response OmpR family regulator
VGDLYIDPGAHSACLASEPLTLTRQEFDLLLALARAPDRVKSRESLLVEVAERDFEAFDRSIDVHISSLRRKLGDDARSPKWIETVRGVGYMLKKPESR